MRNNLWHIVVSIGAAALVSCAPKTYFSNLHTAHSSLTQTRIFPASEPATVTKADPNQQAPAAPADPGQDPAPPSSGSVAPTSGPLTQDPTPMPAPAPATASNPGSSSNLSVPLGLTCSNGGAEYASTFLESQKFDAALYPISGGSGGISQFLGPLAPSFLTGGSQGLPISVSPSFKTDVMNTKVASFYVPNLPDNGDFMLAIKGTGPRVGPVLGDGYLTPTPMVASSGVDYSVIHRRNGQTTVDYTSGTTGLNSDSMYFSHPVVWILYDGFGGNSLQNSVFPYSFGNLYPSTQYSTTQRFAFAPHLNFLAKLASPAPAPVPTFGPPPSTVGGDPNAAPSQPGQTPVVCGTDPNSPVDPLECPLPPVPVTAPPTPPQSVTPPSVSPPSAPPASAPPASSPPSCDQLQSPLVIDTQDPVNQASIALSAPTDGVWFNIGDNYDHLGRAIDRLISWPLDPMKNRLLALPIESGAHAGMILDSNQLFGNNTIGPDHHKAPGGFAALAKYDANGDGIIDKNDPVFAKLRLWSDMNWDGQSDPSELASLEDAGIEAIDLRADRVQEVDQYGNETRQRSVVIMKTGESRAIFDIWFRPVASRPTWVR